MNELDLKIQHLKIDIEKRVGRPLKSPIDFDLLSYKIQKCINEQISSTTIKRLWGYVPSTHQPRFSTLSTLSRFIGFPDWDSYCQGLAQEEESESFTKKCIASAELKDGSLIEIGWKPNRYCVIKCIGECEYIVVKSQNAKIQVGDVFSADQFHLNRPLIITNLKQINNTNMSNEPVNYIAGYQTGLSLLALIEE